MVRRKKLKVKARHSLRSPGSPSVRLTPHNSARGLLVPQVFHRRKLRPREVK